MDRFSHATHKRSVGVGSVLSLKFLFFFHVRPSVPACHAGGLTECTDRQRKNTTTNKFMSHGQWTRGLTLVYRTTGDLYLLPSNTSVANKSPPLCDLYWQACTWRKKLYCRHLIGCCSTGFVSLLHALCAFLSGHRKQQAQLKYETWWAYRSNVPQQAQLLLYQSHSSPALRLCSFLLNLAVCLKISSVHQRLV